MGKLKNNQNGFSASELLLVVIIIMVIGVVGGLVYHDQQYKKSTAKNTHTAQTTSNSSSNTFTSSDKLFTVSVPTGWLSAENDDTGVAQVGTEKYYSNVHYTFSPASAYASSSPVVNPPQIVIYAYQRDGSGGYQPWSEYLASFEQAKNSQSLTINGASAWKVTSGTNDSGVVSYYVVKGDVVVNVISATGAQYLPQANLIAMSLKFNR
jgi:hypothetical protein